MAGQPTKSCLASKIAHCLIDRAPKHHGTNNSNLNSGSSEDEDPDKFGLWRQVCYVQQYHEVTFNFMSSTTLKLSAHPSD